MRLRVLSLFATTVAVAATVGVVPAVADVLPDSSAYGSYLPNAPQRLLDTRLNGGAPVGPRGSVVVTPVAPTGVVPTAVVVNVTAVAPTSSGYLTAYPEGTPPLASSVNFPAGRTVANLVTVKVGTDGMFRVYNGFGSTHVVVDQLGVYTDTTPGARGGGYHPLLDGPQRALDTRSDGGGQVPSGFYITVPFRDANLDNGSSIAAVALNVTVPNAKGSGYITLWDAKVNIPPKASTLNFTAGQTVANSAIVPTSCQPTTGPCTDAVVGFYNGSSAAVDFVVDVVGFYDNGTIAGPIRFEPLATPIRIVDSRTKLGLNPLGTGGRAAFTAPSSVVDGSSYGSAVGIDANLTLVQPTLPSYLTLWPKTGDLPKPTTSNVNAAAGQVVANHVIQELGAPAKAVNIFNYAGTANVVVDVGGRFVRIDGNAAGTDKARPSGARLTVGSPTLHRATS